MKSLNVSTRVGLGLAPVIVVGLLWWFVPSESSIYMPRLPTVLDVLSRDWLFDYVPTDLWPSVRNLVIGFLLAALLGVGLGLVLYLVPTLGAIASPLVHFVRSVPPPLLVPFAILALGVGAPMKISVIAVGAMWPTVLATWDGARAVRLEVHEMASVYRLTLAQRIRYVILPAASSDIFGGLRTTLQISVILIVVSEMVAATNGLGYRVLYAQQTFAVPETWAGTIVLGLLGVAANVLFALFERRVLHWKRVSQQEAGNR